MEDESVTIISDKGIDNLVDNTTVIAVNITEVGGGGDSQVSREDDGDTEGSLLGKPTISVTRTPSNRSANCSREVVKGKKLGHRRVKDGAVTYKKFETTQLMGSIQLGIQQAVGSLAGEEEGDLLHTHFYTINTVTFTRDGSYQKTPAHNYSQFKFRTYAPLAFRKFRNIFEIERDMFLVSLCAEPMVELSNPGASGSIFYLTQDDEIICKTVSHKESRFLQEILPAYYLNLHQNRRTLLPKFFGFYCYSCNTKNVRIIVMKNLLPSGLKMHHKFDLKGSTYKRKSSKKEREKSSPTYKDLDFMEMYPEGILLQADLYHSLMDTIERDCKALESLKIMDYSFLMGIHNLTQASARRPQSLPVADQAGLSSGDSEADGGSSTGSETGARKPHMLERVGSFTQRQRLIAHSTALESITAEVDAVADIMDEADTDQEVNKLGGIPAKNHRGENLLLFIGIIDILQSFGMAKKLEHAWKSIVHDGDTVSVHRPSFYATRFKTFLKEKVFRKMPTPLKPALSFRRSHFRRTLSKDESNTPMRPDGPTRRSQSSSETAGVTVITISGEQSQSVLPSVLRDRSVVVERDRPARGRHPSPGDRSNNRLSGSLDQEQSGGRTRPGHNRPDVADVVAAASCTPPPGDRDSTELCHQGGVTSGDERVQIYVPSPQSTPYSTIQKHHTDPHKSITFLHYRAEPESSITSTTTTTNESFTSTANNSKDGSTLDGDDDDVFHENKPQLYERTNYVTRSHEAVQQKVTRHREVSQQDVTRSYVYTENSQQEVTISTGDSLRVATDSNTVSITDSQNFVTDSLNLSSQHLGLEPDSLMISTNSHHLEPDSLNISDGYSEQLQEPISLSEINIEMDKKS